MENELVILDFYANWCSPCKRLIPILEEIEQETGVKVKKIDIDEDDDTPHKYNVRNIPTLIFLKNGVQVDKSVGTTTKQNLIDRITLINQGKINGVQPL